MKGELTFDVREFLDRANEQDPLAAHVLIKGFHLLQSQLKAAEQERSEYRATLEKVKMNHSYAWDYAVRHPDNAGLGIPLIIEGVDDALSKYPKADKEGK